jgi:hypothetical protein
LLRAAFFWALLIADLTAFRARREATVADRRTVFAERRTAFAARRTVFVARRTVRLTARLRGTTRAAAPVAAFAAAEAASTAVFVAVAAALLAAPVSDCAVSTTARVALPSVPPTNSAARVIASLPVAFVSRSSVIWAPIQHSARLRQGFGEVSPERFARRRTFRVQR